MSHYFILLSCPFFEFPREFGKKPGQRWSLLLCQNLCSTACSKIFQAPGMCAVRAPTVSQARLAPRRKVSFGKKESLFPSFNIAQTGFYQAVKRSSQCGKRRMVFIGVPRKKFSQILSFSKDFWQQFHLFHVHLFFMWRTCSLSSLQLQQSAKWSLLWVLSHLTF